MDDGSVDGTIRELDAVDDGRLRVLRHDHPKGVSAARNLGLAHVAAPWVAFLDDDDVWSPGHLSAMLGAIRRSSRTRERVGLVFSGHLDLNGDREVTNVTPAAPAESVREGLRRMNLVGCPSRVLLSTEAVEAVGGFDTRLSVVADWDLWVRVVAGHEIVRCPELLVGYMRHTGNMHLDAQRFLADLAMLQEKYGWGDELQRDSVFGDLLPSYVAETYRASGQRVRAARWYARSFRARRNPRDLARAAGVLLGERLTELSGLRTRSNVDPTSANGSRSCVARSVRRRRPRPTARHSLDRATP